ncbi:MAG TPA: hypothetical protein VJB57_07575 [Dehalococcoidia bacterium]|nr:hypothetical protein [Dehalococcoidia bacterium]
MNVAIGRSRLWQHLTAPYIMAALGLVMATGALAGVASLESDGPVTGAQSLRRSTLPAITRRPPRETTLYITDSQTEAARLTYFIHQGQMAVVGQGGVIDHDEQVIVVDSPEALTQLALIAGESVQANQHGFDNVRMVDLRR